MGERPHPFALKAALAVCVAAVASALALLNGEVVLGLVFGAGCVASALYTRRLWRR